MMQAEKDGVNMGKEWHAKMVNTRDSHADLNGARVPLHEPFHTIWGNDLMYPGDPSAPASEVINCHCGIRPVVLRPGEVLQPTPAPSGKVAISVENGIIKADKTISGHGSTPKKAEPNMVIDRLGKNGAVNARSFYDSNGIKFKEIHTNSHGNPKKHPYGAHGEHAHDYKWDKDGKMVNRSIRELTGEEREGSRSILE